MNRMLVSKQRKTTPFRHAFIKDLVEMDSEWAVHCTYEEIIQASDIIKKSAAGQAVTGRKQWYYLYRTKRWKSMRKRQLSRHPNCNCDCHRGEKVSANTADHVEPHKGDKTLFFNGKLQSLCAHCHNSCKQSYERSGYAKGCDEMGLPIDTEHLWNRGETTPGGDPPHDLAFIAGSGAGPDLP